MKLSSIRLRWGVVVLLAVAAVSYGVWRRSRAKQVVQRVQSVDQSTERENKDLLSRIPTLGFDSITGSGDAPESDVPFPIESGSETDRVIRSIEDVIGSAPGVGEERADDQLRASLIRAVSEFLYFRFIRDDLETYVRWRLHRGDSFRSAEIMHTNWMVASDYESYFGRELGDSQSLRDVFLEIARFRESSIPDSQRPVGMTIDPSGLILGFDHAGTDLGYGRVDLGSDERVRFWYEPRLGSHRCWFGSGIDYDSAELVLSAIVGVVMEYADGSKRPMMVLAFLDPSVGHWSIERLWTNDYGIPGGLIEF